jgi:putative hemolysin
MNSTALFWLFSTFFWTSLMSFFSMQEMACISFNRLRLELSIRSGSKRALWIKNMLDNPVLLFGTTLIGVNVALVVSSESMRQFLTALHVNPNYAPCFHIPYVLIFGELVPMFAARRHPEHMAKLGIPLLWLVSKILSPVTLFIDFCCSLLRSLFVKKETQKGLPHLQRDELEELLEERKRGYFDEAVHESLSAVFLHFEKSPSLPL